MSQALFTGLSGLSAHSRQIDIIGNNIANTSTTGFKASRAVFATQFSLTSSYGSGPNGEMGGTNPNQTGLGTSVVETLRNHNGGSIQATGVSTDLAIEGRGFFVTREGGTQYFTRAGQFNVDEDNYLSSPSGGILQGYGVDESFNIVEGPLVDIEIATGILSFSEATSNIALAGTLNSSGPTATTGSQHLTQAMTDLNTGLAATGGTLLTDLSTDGVTPMFTLGDTIDMNNVEIFGSNIGPHSFEVGPVGGPTTADAIGDTLTEFMQFIENAIGLDASVGGGVGVTGAGEIQIDGNLGDRNDLNIDSQVFSVNSTTLFSMNKPVSADGESVTTAITAYDSLGAALTVDITMTKTMQTTGQTQWAYNAYSRDSSNLNKFLGSGVLTYDANGILQNVSDAIIDLDRSGTGAETPLAINLEFSGPNGLNMGSDNNPNSNSQMTGEAVDGAPIGTLETFGVESNGVINGVFTNGRQRTIGQVALASFTNPEGLIEVGGNRFQIAPNSGNAIISTPGAFGTGDIVSGGLELSNTDLSQEFVNLITASTGFSANSRVITTADELLQQLLLQL